MVYDPIACDYRYKCLNSGVYNAKNGTGCPHAKECNILLLVARMVRRHYKTASYRKNKNGRNNKNPIKQDLFDVFYESLQRGFKCSYCNTIMTLDRGYLNSVTFDHITARCLGGDNSKRNLTLCCNSCNRNKNIFEIKALSQKNGVES